jgi:hypothetical protein
MGDHDWLLVNLLNSNLFRVTFSKLVVTFSYKLSSVCSKLVCLSNSSSLSGTSIGISLSVPTIGIDLSVPTKISVTMNVVVSNMTLKLVTSKISSLNVIGVTSVKVIKFFSM